MARGLWLIAHGRGVEEDGALAISLVSPSWECGRMDREMDCRGNGNGFAHDNLIYLSGVS